MDINVFENNTCCFFGHRKITETDEIKSAVYAIIENLIIYKNVDTFLFGSKSGFDTLCYKTVSKLKEQYTHIKRIYVRAEYPYIDENYKAYLLEKYEETYFPERMVNAGRAVYVERNFEMIDKSTFCIVYYDENYLPPKRKAANNAVGNYQPKSGTKIAYEYAKKKKKKIFLLSAKVE